MKKTKKIDRRTFINQTASTAAGITIVPSNVIAGLGHVPPSDKIQVANIGCGTQGLREMAEMLQHPNIQVAAICDPNKGATGYLDWSPNGLLNNIRKTLADDHWGSQIKGIPGGLDVTEDYVNKYDEKNGSGHKVKTYEDFRELLNQEQNIDLVKIMTPDHTHASIAIMAMKKGKHVITHKPIANRMSEGRLTIETARQTGVKTNLLAWDEKPQYDLIRKWIEDGVIGKLKEIHNWSYRPVWPQWTSNPKDTPPTPEGFNWDLWLGPVPHRPYHPNYTHNVFRGWYDFGGGSVADMGHYSLFPLFQTLDIQRPPISAKAYGTTQRTAIDGVCRWIENDVAFPPCCLIKWQFPEQTSLPAFDLFWYDGGMKPFAPEELEIDDRDIPQEGMLIVGDKGKILGGFRGEDPEIIPKAKMDSYTGNKTVAEVKNDNRTDGWVQAILKNEETPGSFLNAECVTETINLAAVALRAGKKINYDSKNMRITNDEEANKFLTREYRTGWELG